MTTEKPQSSPVINRLTQMLVCHDLPDPLPAEPMGLLVSWFEDARSSGKYDDFNAMTLATATLGAAPSARIVLCKQIEPDRPAIVFYTSYTSRKGQELESNSIAAAVLHWPHAKRQVRIEGRVERTTAAESDAYFNTRPLASRIGACVSAQSQPLESREKIILDAVKKATGAAMGFKIRRPSSWGGYRIIVKRVELWSAGTGQIGRASCRERV